MSGFDAFFFYVAMVLGVWMLAEGLRWAVTKLILWLIRR